MKSSIDDFSLEQFKSNTEIFISHLNGDWKIPCNMHISQELYMYLKDLITRNIDVNLVLQQSKNHGAPNAYNYTLTQTCNLCNKQNLNSLNKTKLLNYLKTDNYVCPDCLQKQKQAKHEQQEANLQHFEELRESTTDEYIDAYINPNNKWNDGISTRDKYIRISQRNVNWLKVEHKIKQLSYSDFLKTPYWKAIADETKRMAGYKCKLCGKSENLSTHHRTYDIHGKEHIYNVMKNDLIVLCDNCHKKFHDIINI